MKTKKFQAQNILKTFFLAVLGLQMAIILALAVQPASALAADAKPIEFQPQIKIPGTPFDAVSLTISGDILGKYIQAFYNYGMSVAGILAAIILMAGGVIWLTSGGDSGKVGQAKELILGSIIGLGILFSSWIILNTINPELLKFQAIKPIGIAESSLTSCCDPIKGNVKADADGECLSGKTCEGEQQCNNKGDNTFDCIDEADFVCCQYTNASASLSTCYSIPRATPQPPCPATITRQYTGFNREFNYETSYLSQYCLPNFFDSEIGQNCLTIEETCIGKDNGSLCNDGWCYNGICMYNDGKENEPCGNEGGRCLKEQTTGDNCPPGYSRDRFGRSCETELFCCKPDKNLSY